MSKSTEKLVAKKSLLGATPPPAESVVIEEVDIDEIDPSTMDYDEWLAGLREWQSEGHEPGDIPLERPQWDALLRRRAARIDKRAAKEKLRLEQRQAAIKSLKPPPCDIVADAKSISDAEAALSETKEKLFEAWDRKFNQLPVDVSNGVEGLQSAMTSCRVSI